MGPMGSIGINVLSVYETSKVGEVTLSGRFFGPKHALFMHETSKVSEITLSGRFFGPKNALFMQPLHQGRGEGGYFYPILALLLSWLDIL